MVTREDSRTRPPGSQRGRLAEDRALDFLRRRGLTLLARNHACRRGEIDLVMHDQDVLVFVEVRYRRHDRFGTAAESVTATKIERIRLAATDFLLRNPRFAEQPVRFDLVTLSGPPDEPLLQWLQDAF